MTRNCSGNRFPAPFPIPHPHSAFFILPSAFTCGPQLFVRDSARKGDAFHDVVMMALLRKEWPPAQKLDRPGASIATTKAFLDAAPKPPGEE